MRVRTHCTAQHVIALIAIILQIRITMLRIGVDCSDGVFNTHGTDTCGKSCATFAAQKHNAQQQRSYSTSLTLLISHNAVTINPLSITLSSCNALPQSETAPVSAPTAPH